MKYTKEHYDFICQVAPGRYNDEITQMFNKKFGTDIKVSQINAYKKNHGIKSNVSRHRSSNNTGLFNKNQMAFILANVEGKGNQDLVDLVNKTFNLSITKQQMKTWKANHNISSGLTGYFNKGHAPANKGTKGLYNVGGNKTSFKKGQKAHNYKPVGSERIDRDGYLLVKIRDDGPWHKRWRAKHKVIWENVNGPVPPGHKLIFADQNKKNISLNNLILIKDSQLATLNKKGLLQKDAELNKTALILTELYQKMSKRSRENSSK